MWHHVFTLIIKCNQVTALLTIPKRKRLTKWSSNMFWYIRVHTFVSDTVTKNFIKRYMYFILSTFACTLQCFLFFSHWTLDGKLKWCMTDRDTVVFYVSLNVLWLQDEMAYVTCGMIRQDVGNFNKSARDSCSHTLPQNVWQWANPTTSADKFFIVTFQFADKKIKLVSYLKHRRTGVRTLRLIRGERCVIRVWGVILLQSKTADYSLEWIIIWYFAWSLAVSRPTA